MGSAGIDSALATVAAKEDRDASEGRAVLPCGGTGSPTEQVGCSLNVRCIAHEVDITTDGLLRREKTLQTVLELPDPDRDSLPTDENDVLSSTTCSMRAMMLFASSRLSGAGLTSVKSRGSSTSMTQGRYSGQGTRGVQIDPSLAGRKGKALRFALELRLSNPSGPQSLHVRATVALLFLEALSGIEIFCGLHVRHVQERITRTPATIDSIRHS